MSGPGLISAGRPRPRLLAGSVAGVLSVVCVTAIMAHGLVTGWIDLLIDVSIGGCFMVVGSVILLRAGWNGVGWVLVAMGAMWATFGSIAVVLPRSGPHG